MLRCDWLLHIVTRDQVPSTTQENHHRVVAMARTHGK